jgi:hypothetical protein
VLPLHPSIVLPLSTIRGPWLTALWIRITLPLSGRLGACGVEEDSLRRPVHSKGWLDGLFAQESRPSSSSLVCSVSRRILESNPGPSVSPEWTGTTVVRPSGCRIK